MAGCGSLRKGWGVYLVMSSTLTRPESFHQPALDKAASSGSTLGENDLPFKLPTRIITCAWGERYISELLSITLPALLAPGNLPYVASVVSCELVILTDQASFSRILGDVTVRKIRELCSVRLVEIDDLIPSPDQYGMAITYALHRGFSDLGQSATDTWLLFLNSDFILADRSLRSVVRHLARGERLIASPSYCVKAETAAPDLLKRVDPRSRALSVPPRAMAALVLRHWHDSVRGKTVNQAAVSIRYMDQFYWLVDSNTLLGHQMPVSIVGMRPERTLPEPNSFWDYGLIREFCPNAEHFVLGDSDEFLMMELRRGHVTEDWVVKGWPQPQEIARNMISFATPYTKDMARHELTLHSAELPDGIDDARAKLRAFVDSVFVHLPAVLPSHLGHPQFDYHWPTFMEVRHKYLSTRLGSATETEEPPASLSELDRVWWKLDGLTKAYSNRRVELTNLMDQQRGVIGALHVRLKEVVSARRTEADERLLHNLGAMQPCDHKRQSQLNRVIQLQPNETASTGLSLSATNEPSWIKPILDDEEQWTRFASEVREKREFLTNAAAFVDKHYKDRLSMLELDFEAAREPLQFEYERLLGRRTRSAAIPHVVTAHGPQTVDIGSGGNALLGMARRIYHKLYGKLPRVRPTHPYWAAMRHLIRLVDTAAAKGAANVLVIGSGGVADTVAKHLPGLHVQVSMSEFMGGNFRQAFLEPVKFDLCICSLGPSELPRFREMTQLIAPYMNSDGKILGFYPNFGLSPISRDEIVVLQNILDLPWLGRLYYAGSNKSARVVRRFHAALRGGSGQLARLARMATMLLVVTPHALAANRLEAAAPEEQSSRLPKHCTSITIEITM
jgi:hypothetical protein